MTHTEHGSVLEHSNFSVFVEGVTRALTLEFNRHRPFSISQRSTRYAKEEDSDIVLEPYYASIWDKYQLRYDSEINTVMMPETVAKRIGVPPQYDTSSYLEWSEIAAWKMTYDNLELDLVVSNVINSMADIAQYKKEVEMCMELNPNNYDGFDLRKWARGKARNKLPHSLETRGTWTGNVRAWRWFIELRSNRYAEPEIRRLAEKLYIALQPFAPIYWEDFHLDGIVDGIPEYVPEYHKV